MEDEGTFDGVLPLGHLADAGLDVGVVEVVPDVEVVGQGLVGQDLLHGVLLLHQHDRHLHALLLGDDEREERVLVPGLLLVLAAASSLALPLSLWKTRQNARI